MTDQPPSPRLMTAIDHAPQSTADQNVDPNSMRQTPSPSAAALALVRQIKGFIGPEDAFYANQIDAFAAQAVAAAQVKQHERGPNEKGRTFYEDPAVCDPPKTLVSICPHPAKCEEMAWAAERAKPYRCSPRRWR